MILCLGKNLFVITTLVYEYTMKLVVCPKLPIKSDWAEWTYSNIWVAPKLSSDLCFSNKNKHTLLKDNMSNPRSTETLGNVCLILPAFRARHPDDLGSGMYGLTIDVLSVLTSERQALRVLQNNMTSCKSPVCSTSNDRILH